MQQTAYHSIDTVLRQAANDLNGLSGSRLRRRVKRKAQDLDVDVEPYLDEAVPGQGQKIDYVSENKRHIGLATTIRYEQTGEFKDDYLERAPWVGYGATVSKDDLDGATISAFRAFHKAKFKEDSLHKTRWESTHQAHHAVVEENALNHAVIAPSTSNNFYHATFHEGSAKDSTWYGENNAEWANIPNEGFLDHIRVKGVNNFAYRQV